MADNLMTLQSRSSDFEEDKMNINKLDSLYLINNKSYIIDVFPSLPLKNDYRHSLQIAHLMYYRWTYCHETAAKNGRSYGPPT